MSRDIVKEPPSEVADRLHSSAIRLLRRLRRQDATSGLTGPQASALSMLVFGGSMNLGVLAAAEQVKPPTMSRLVKDMEANGLVRREPDPHDARGVILAPTEKGRAMFDRARELRLDALRRAIADLPDEDQAGLSRAAALIHALVHALDGTPPRP